MNAYTADDLRDGLAAVGVRRGDVVFVHSALFALGRLRGVPIRAIPETLTEALLDHLGPGGTLVVPAFNFGFCRGEGFDRQRTPSERMGPIAELVRERPGAFRSRHPIQSVAAVGRDAGAVCAGDPPGAFDDDGPFGHLVRAGATLLQIGGTTISLAHVPEQLAEVPYRFWKSFTGPYADGGAAETRTYRMFARDLDVAPEPYFERVLDPMRRDGKLAEAPLGAGRLRAFGFRDFVDESLRQLARDPYALVRDPDRVRPYYE